MQWGLAGLKGLEGDAEAHRFLGYPLGKEVGNKVVFNRVLASGYCSAI